MRNRGHAGLLYKRRGGETGCMLVCCMQEEGEGQMFLLSALYSKLYSQQSWWGGGGEEDGILFLPCLQQELFLYSYKLFRGLMFLSCGYLCNTETFCYHNIVLKPVEVLRIL